MNRRDLWIIPMVIGVSGFLALGGLGLFLWGISRSSMVTWVMDPTYPFYLLAGPIVSFISYKKWRASEKTQEPEERDTPEEIQPGWIDYIVYRISFPLRLSWQASCFCIGVVFLYLAILQGRPPMNRVPITIGIFLCLYPIVYELIQFDFHQWRKGHELRG